MKSFQNTVISVSNTELSWITQVKTAVREAEERHGDTTRIYLVSTGEDESGLIGLVTCLRKEPYSENIRCIFSPTKKMVLDFDKPSPILAKILEHDLVMNVFDENRDWGCYIIGSVAIPEPYLKEVSNAFLDMGRVGDLTTFQWVEGYSVKDFSSGMWEAVDVYFSAINFRDVMFATGNLQPDKRRLPFALESALGLEFSGISKETGKRMFGLCESQAIATEALANRYLCWEVPQGWSLEEAATVGAVYSTVMNSGYKYQFFLISFPSKSNPGICI